MTSTTPNAHDRLVTQALLGGLPVKDILAKVRRLGVRGYSKHTRKRALILYLVDDVGVVARSFLGDIRLSIPSQVKAHVRPEPTYQFKGTRREWLAAMRRHLKTFTVAQLRKTKKVPYGFKKDAMIDHIIGTMAIDTRRPITAYFAHLKA